MKKWKIQITCQGYKMPEQIITEESFNPEIPNWQKKEFNSLAIGERKELLSRTNGGAVLFVERIS